MINIIQLENRIEQLEAQVEDLVQSIVSAQAQQQVLVTALKTLKAQTRTSVLQLAIIDEALSIASFEAHRIKAEDTPA